jgi:isocitrate dehydrogenase (NAD+)
MLMHLNLNSYGIALRRAVEQVIREGKVRTRDMAGYASTTEFANAVVDKFQMDEIEQM